jgi:hypothetical protein
MSASNRRTKAIAPAAAGAIAFFFACAVLASFARGIAQTTPSAQEYYLAALAQMRAVPSPPPFITYRAEIPAGNGTLFVRRGAGGRADLMLAAGGPTHANRWLVSYRSSDRLASIPLADGTHVLSSLALFDPTWNGVDEWMRHGLTATDETREPSAAPAPGTPALLPVIAVVSAMSPGNYDIEDAGAADCDGRAGHALRLTATRDPQSHPLSGVTVDLATQRFCSMRFNLRAGGAGSVTGTVELRFGDVGGYDLVTGGRIEGNARSIGISVGSFTIPFAYAAMAFPATLPDATFAAQTPAPAPSRREP